MIEQLTDWISRFLEAGTAVWRRLVRLYHPATLKERGLMWSTGLLFLTLLLLTHAVRFLKLSFFLSWWAYSFPMAAVTIATLLMYQQLQLVFFKWLGAGLLGLLTLIIVTLLVKTISAVIRRDSAVED